MKRPDWDEYFLSIAFTVSIRSDDLFIKHGAVIVCNLTKHILGTGYNNTPAGFDTNLIDMKNRDERRPYMKHAEDNAIKNMSRNPFELKDGSTIYITGKPCCDCLSDIINAGITDIVMADRIGSIQDNDAMYSNLIKNKRLHTIRRMPIPAIGRLILGLNE